MIAYECRAVNAEAARLDPRRPFLDIKIRCVRCCSMNVPQKHRRLEQAELRVLLAIHPLHIDCTIDQKGGALATEGSRAHRTLLLTHNIQRSLVL